MSKPTLYPLVFIPIYKDYLWGGRNLETVLGREIPAGVVAESWEISGHPDGLTRVQNGPLAGLDLPAIQEQLGVDLVGERNRYALKLGRFPLLIKLLDANRWLSVQVHPQDDYALAHEGDLGKTEMWVVLHAEPGAELIYGFTPGVSREKFAQAVAAGQSEKWLQRVPAQAGDVFFVPAGSVHALGPGLLVAEIQQNSNTTYRIYDWGRVGADGQPRALHVEQGLAVMDFDQVQPGSVQPQPIFYGGHPGEEIGHCVYFQTERLALHKGETLSGHCDGATFEIWGVLQGEATIQWAGEPISVTGVGWVLLPAALGDFQVQAQTESVLLRVVTPEQESKQYCSTNSTLIQAQKK